MFEKLCLETFQSGLSWRTILTKRDNFRLAFQDFDFHKVATFDDQKVEALLANKNIVRNKRKILAVINNAKRGWQFVGSTTLYAFMKSMRLINDHEEPCFLRDKIDQARREFIYYAFST